MSRESESYTVTVAKKTVKDIFFGVFLLCLCFLVNYGVKQDIFKSVMAFLTK